MSAPAKSFPGSGACRRTRWPRPRQVFPGDRQRRPLPRRPAVPWETNLDDAAYLKKPLADGEAFIWYLKHSGWALKTKSALLVFDYWDNDLPPDKKLLANGHIDPAGLAGLKVYVFAGHDHGDHFDRQVLDWKNALPGIQYVLGFESDVKDGAIAMAPRTERRVGDLTVTTIRANDAGVGFAVKVDGLTIFHAGDHSNNTVETAGNDFLNSRPSVSTSCQGSSQT